MCLGLRWVVLKGNRKSESLCPDPESEMPPQPLLPQATLGCRQDRPLYFVLGPGVEQREGLDPHTYRCMSYLIHLMGDARVTI